MTSNVTLTQYLSKVRYLFYGVTPADCVEKLEDIPDYIQEASTFFLLFVALEWLYLACTKRGDKFRLNEALASFSSGLLMKLLTVVFVNMDFYAYIWVHENYAMIKVPWNSVWAWWACFLAVDMCYYWFHRMAHEINLMWAAHQVHHSSEDYNLATAIRKSVLQNYTSWVFYIPLAPFIPPQIFVSHLQFNLLYQFWIHAAVIGNLGPFEWLFNTPSHHRVHHGRNRYCINKNYGGILIVWDRLFGTFEAENEEVVYGLTHLVQSFEPTYIQVCHLVLMWKRLKSSSSWSEKCSIFIKGPGWGPNKPRLGLKEEIPDARAPVVKYQPKVSRWDNWLMCAHFLAIAICFQEFNTRIHSLSNTWIALFMVYVLMCLSAIGATLDNKAHSSYLQLASSLMLVCGQLYVGPFTFVPFVYSGWITNCVKLCALLSALYWATVIIVTKHLKSKPN